MKYLGIISLVANIVLAIFVYQNWQQQQSIQHQLESSAEDNKRLRAELVAARDELKFVSQKLVALEKTSIKGIADKANNAFLDGWESLIGIVGKEIESARKEIQKQKQQYHNGSGTKQSPPSRGAEQEEQSASQTQKKT